MSENRILIHETRDIGLSIFIWLILVAAFPSLWYRTVVPVITPLHQNIYQFGILFDSALDGYTQLVIRGIFVYILVIIFFGIRALLGIITSKRHGTKYYFNTEQQALEKVESRKKPEIGSKTYQLRRDTVIEIVETSIPSSEGKKYSFTLKTTEPFTYTSTSKSVIRQFFEVITQNSRYSLKIILTRQGMSQQVETTEITQLLM